MPTIKEIAKISGVSPTTVSNVVHKRFSKVSPEKRKIVENVIEELNYSPNMGAMILANHPSKIIGIISYLQGQEGKIPLVDPYVAGMVGSLEMAIREKGYFTMLHSSNSSVDIAKLIDNWKFSGLVFMGIEPGMCEELYKKIKIPIVLIDSYLEEESIIEKTSYSYKRYFNVGSDDFQGGYDLTNYLIARGHKDILFVSDEEDLHGPGKQRYKGYSKALMERNLTIHKSFTIPKNKAKREKLYEQQFKDLSNLPYSALFFASDFYAIDAIRYFRKLGLSIPKDISVVGFDNSEYAYYCEPPLTTVNQNLRWKGEAAINMLLELINSGKVRKSNIKLPTTLVIRNSVSSK